MKKVFLFISVLFIWTISLTSQINREQADEIVLNYLQNEVTQPYTLYINITTPSDKYFTLNTSNEELIKVKYACWIYFLNESEFSRNRYLMVKKDNGSLIEIIANNDFGPKDFSLWRVIDINNNLIILSSSVRLLYPNPVSDWLTLLYTGERVRFEIYDLKGTKLFSEILTGKNTCQLNVSFLKSGIYLVNIDGKTFKIFKK